MTVQKKIFNDPGLALGPAVDASEGGRDSGFDLTGLLQIVRARRRIIIGTAIAVVAVTAIFVFRMTPLYDATALVMLDQRQNKVMDVDAVLAGLPTDPTSIENQIQILRSRSLMSRVIDKLHLDQNVSSVPDTRGLASNVLFYANPLHWFGAPAVMETKEQREAKRREKIIDGLLAAETVIEQGRSSALLVTFRAANPARAALMANAIADAYVEDQLNAKFDATQKTSQWLAGRLQELTAQMQTADAAVQEYKAENNITETAGGGSILDQQLAQLNGQLIVARSNLAEAQAKYARVRELHSTGRAEDVAQVFQSGMISQFSQQQAELLRQKAQFSTTLGPRHPKMLDIESQLRNIDAKIEEEVKRVVETVSNDVRVSSAQVQSLQASLSQLESKSTVENKAKIKLSELQARAASAHQLYEAFLGKFKETQGQEGIQAPDARIISKAVAPIEPAVPDKLRALEIAAGIGVFLGFLLALLVERLDAGFRTSAQIEHLLGVPVLTTLPELAGSARVRGAADRVIDKPLSAFTESIRGLQMGLVLSNVDDPPKIILITSSVPDEGKTTIALSLARIAASSGQRVVLVDCDLRRAGLVAALQLPEPQNGLVEVLSGQARLDECLVKDPRSSVLFLPASRMIGRPPDILGSAAMERLIAGLKSSYDLVVLDSAPLLPVNDTKVLTPLADAVVLVVRWERTARGAVINAAHMLADIQAPVAGVALTRADAERHRYYNYGYQSHYGYNKYYSE